MHNSYEEATRGQRFINYLIDLLVAYFILLLVVTQITDRLKLTDGISDQQFRIGYLLTLFVYYLVCELVSDRTLGKFITGTKVVTRDFTKPTIPQKMLRTLCRFIPLEPISGFTYPWHDTITKTCVVRPKRAE